MPVLCHEPRYITKAFNSALMDSRARHRLKYTLYIYIYILMLIRTKQQRVFNRALNIDVYILPVVGTREGCGLLYLRIVLTGLLCIVTFQTRPDRSTWDVSVPGGLSNLVDLSKRLFSTGARAPPSSIETNGHRYFRRTFEDHPPHTHTDTHARTHTTGRKLSSENLFAVPFLPTILVSPPIRFLAGP